MNHNQQFDKILDDALSDYRDAEPLSGLEDRVLQRLRPQLEKSPIPWWKWGMVAACVAMFAFAVWLGLRGNEAQAPVAPQQTEARNVDVGPEAKLAAQAPCTVANKHAPVPQSKGQAKVARSAVAQSHVARPDDDGHESAHLSAPLTREERQLLALAQTHPDALRSISQQDQPIAITPLTIEPLPSESNQNGDN
jgi:hypothetical protein